MKKIREQCDMLQHGGMHNYRHSTLLQQSRSASKTAIPAVRELTEKKAQSSGLPVPGGIPRIFTQPSWKGTVAGSTTGATFGFTRLGLTPPPSEELRAAIPLMPGGKGGPPA